MKAWKTQLVNACVNRCAELKVVSFAEVAKELGHNHLKREQILPIISAVLAAVPDYEAIILLDHAGQNKSLFQGLTFCVKDSFR